MADEIGVQHLLDGLTRENAELTFAFYGFTALVSGHITNGLSFDTQASEAGERLASIDGALPSPNVHLQFLADSIRATGKRPPSSVVTED